MGMIYTTNNYVKNRTSFKILLKSIFHLNILIRTNSFIKNKITRSFGMALSSGINLTILYKNTLIFRSRLPVTIFTFFNYLKIINLKCNQNISDFIKYRSYLNQFHLIIPCYSFSKSRHSVADTRLLIQSHQ